MYLSHDVGHPDTTRRISKMNLLGKWKEESTSQPSEKHPEKEKKNQMREEFLPMRLTFHSATVLVSLADVSWKTNPYDRNLVPMLRTTRPKRKSFQSSKHCRRNVRHRPSFGYQLPADVNSQIGNERHRNNGTKHLYQSCSYTDSARLREQSSN